MNTVPPLRRFLRPFAARPAGVYLLVGLAYLAAVLLVPFAVSEYNASRGDLTTPAPPETGPEGQAERIAAGHADAVQVPIDLGISLALVLLASCMWLRFRWAYLTSLSLTALAFATLIVLLVSSCVFEVRSAAQIEGPHIPDAFLWLPLSIVTGLLLLLFRSSGVRRFFRRPPTPPQEESPPT